MKCTCLLQVLACACPLMAAELAPLSAPAFADTEVSTNFPFAFARPRAGRFAFTMDFTATPSNNLEVAFGRDSDADGALGAEEVGLSFAWDCGRWMLTSGGVDADWTAAAATTSAVKSVAWTTRLAGGSTPRVFHVSENGVPLPDAFDGAPPEWLYHADWDTVRVVGRGVDAPGERLSVVVESESFILRLR